MNTPDNGAGRLDSWKAIAAYLARDERTVQRWERQLGLPIRRVPGGRGTSVFAYQSEIDAWLQSTRLPEPADAAVAPAPESPEPPPTAPEQVPPPAPPPAWRWMSRASIIAALVGVVGAAGWYATRSSAAGALTRVVLTPSAVVAFAGGTARWTHAFPAGERVTVPDERKPEPADLLVDGTPAVVVATSLHVRTADDTVRSGELLWFTLKGVLERRLSIDDRVTVGQREYGAPWGITDFRTYRAPDGARRVAVAAHHYQWWPSLVTVLDEGARTGTFVNAGWIERVHWLTSGRLLVAGFSESQDGGVVALLDVNALNGQSPEPYGSRFFCTSCGSDRPIRYVVLPRSEVNRASASRFNRARVELSGGRFVVRTIEMVQGDVEAADAIYEFTPDLRLLHAAFSDRYWEMHALLETRGHLTHDRAHCPFRDGPRGVQAWEPGIGWHAI